MRAKVVAILLAFAVMAKGKEWREGVMTYYTSAEGGEYGAGGRKLVPFESVAVKMHDFEEREGRRLKIKGLHGTFRVDDGCEGGGCKDFDIYVGHSEEAAKEIPDWEMGNIPMRYKWID